VINTLEVNWKSTLPYGFSLSVIMCWLGDGKSIQSAKLLHYKYYRFAFVSVTLITPMEKV